MKGKSEDKMNDPAKQEREIVTCFVLTIIVQTHRGCSLIICRFIRKSSKAFSWAAIINTVHMARLTRLVTTVQQNQQKLL